MTLPTFHPYAGTATHLSNAMPKGTGAKPHMSKSEQVGTDKSRRVRKLESELGDTRQLVRMALAAMQGKLLLPADTTPEDVLEQALDRAEDGPDA